MNNKKTILLLLIALMMILSYSPAWGITDAHSIKDDNNKRLPSIFGDKTQTFQCGETATFKKANITIDNPTSSFIVIREYSYIPQANAFLRVPIKIEAKKKIKFKAKNFGSTVVEEETNCMPKTIELQEGETYTGILCIKWKDAVSTSYVSAPRFVECKKRGCKGIWKFTYEKKIKELKSVEDVEGILPYIPITATVTVDEIHYMGAASGNNYDRIASLKCKEGFYLHTIVSGDNLAQWEKYQESNSKLRIEGIVQNITRESGGNEPIISRCIMVQINSIE